MFFKGQLQCVMLYVFILLFHFVAKHFLFVCRFSPSISSNLVGFDFGHAALCLLFNEMVLLILSFLYLSLSTQTAKNLLSPARFEEGKGYLNCMGYLKGIVHTFWKFDSGNIIC